MDIIKTIVEILCVALVVMLLYAWGYVKQQRQSVDLLRELEKKAKKKIVAILKKKGSMTKKEIENEILNLKVSLFFSKNKAVIKDPKVIAKTIIENLIDSDIVDVDNNKGSKRYILKQQ